MSKDNVYHQLKILQGVTNALRAIRIGRTNGRLSSPNFGPYNVEYYEAESLLMEIRKTRIAAEALLDGAKVK